MSCLIKLVVMFTIFISCSKDIPFQKQPIENKPDLLVKPFSSPLSNVVLPSNLAPIKFKFHPENKKSKLYLIHNNNKYFVMSVKENTDSLVIQENDWSTIKKITNSEPFELHLFTYDQKNRAETKYTVTLRFDSFALDALIFFRKVPLPMPRTEDLDKISWHISSISNNAPPRAVIQKSKHCINCHSFSLDGKTFAVEYNRSNDDKSGYVIARNISDTSFKFYNKDIFSWNSKQVDRLGYQAVFSSISSDGRYVVSTNAAKVINVDINNPEYFSYSWPTAGILSVYDRKQNRFFSLHGADNPNFIHANPTWSPDGKNIYFARAKVNKKLFSIITKELHLKFSKEEIEKKFNIKFDLYKIPFNNGKGGHALALLGASNNGKSNYYPKVSPDGKWVAFTQSQYGMMLIRPDSDIFLVPANGGNLISLKSNSPQADSWHSWSPDSKWLLFSSKRDSLFTNLYITRIDDNGQASNALMIDWLKDDSEEYSLNLPEFINIPSSQLNSFQVDAEEIK